jgi:2-polyprenyl-3-methyl-5-hydroxy-6-metoxy-1,4-benzoquinol methylase
MTATQQAGLVKIPCPLCGCDQSAILFKTRDYAFRCSDDRFTVRRCRSCGAGYLSPRPREEDVLRYYPPEFYWSWEQSPSNIDWQTIIDRRRNQLKAKAAWIMDMVPGRLLDVGAQKGEFIWFMQQHGWQAEGVEIDQSVPNPKNLPIHYGDFLTLPLSPSSYDCITLWAVLEHVYHPARFIARAAELLRPGGRLVILVTNLKSIQARWFRADDYPRHLTIFTRASIGQLVQQHGLKVTRFHTGQEIFGGALNGGLVFLLKRLGGYTSDEIFYEWKAPHDPELFWAKWRGRRSSLVRWVSRLDRALTWPLEKLLDRMGFGFILTVSAEKVHQQ